MSICKGAQIMRDNISADMAEQCCGPILEHSGHNGEYWPK